jgi:hypothetical protein
MDKKEKKLSVYYDGPIDSELDADLIETMNNHGWIWYGSGVEIASNKRDLSFYKEIMEEK